MKHRGGSPTGGSHHCFSWSPVERPCYHNREPGHLISSVVEVCVPSLKRFPELSMSQGLKPLLCSGKWIPSLWTTMVSYEWPCMPCDIIAVLRKGHGNVAAPLKHTHPRISRTFGWLQCFIDASAQSWKTLQESGCWADSTIQKEDQWCGFRVACKSKLCRSLPSDLFTHVIDFSGKHLREHLDSRCAAVSFIGSAHGHSLFLGAGYQVQYWCRHCMKKRKKPKRSEAQTWEGFKKHGRDGGLNRPPTDLEYQQNRSWKRPRTLQLPPQRIRAHSTLYRIKKSSPRGLFSYIAILKKPGCEQEGCADLHEPTMALPVGIPSEHWSLQKDWEPPSGRIQPSKSKIQMQSNLLPVQEKAKV